MERPYITVGVNSYWYYTTCECGAKIVVQGSSPANCPCGRTTKMIGGKGVLTSAELEVTHKYSREESACLSPCTSPPTSET